LQVLALLALTQLDPAWSITASVVFVMLVQGPSDLAADMGFIGQAGAAEVKAAVVDAMTKIVASGKAAGILTLDTELQQQCRDIGATFIASEIDVTLFARNMRGAAKDAAERLRETQATTGHYQIKPLETGRVTL
jgi:2-keto-3-deoxy-L-rhamnonate aldolase RhmA